VSGVLVTHDWSAVLRLCEHTCQLADGRVVAEGHSESIICDYLQLADQLDPTAHARFAPDTPVASQAVSGAEWVFDAPINLTCHGPVLFNYSVEKLVLGQDWQILFMGRETEVASEPGRHKARIRVPAMPLPAGTYRLNLFLAGPRPAGGGARPAFDIRSWTTGNSLLLTVEGVKTPGLISLPCVEEAQ
jgi:lipopolysaccharide transport system ATP-binding protein